VTNSLDYSEATRIVEKLGHLPLAIDQAGAYLNRPSKPLHAFLPLFEVNFKTTLGKKSPTAVYVMPCQAMPMVVVRVASGTCDILVFWAA
jgi:hypothetical protein